MEVKSTDMINNQHINWLMSLAEEYSCRQGGGDEILSKSLSILCGRLNKVASILDDGSTSLSAYPTRLGQLPGSDMFNSFII